MKISPLSATALGARTLKPHRPHQAVSAARQFSLVLAVAAVAGVLGSVVLAAFTPAPGSALRHAQSAAAAPHGAAFQAPPADADLLRPLRRLCEAFPSPRPPARPGALSPLPPAPASGATFPCPSLPYSPPRRAWRLAELPASLGARLGLRPAALTGITTRVSVGPAGLQANRGSGYPSVSADGSCIAFESSASNLVIDDTNTGSDIFVHYLSSKQTVRVSVASHGAQANAESYRPALSPDGRFVAFWSAATNLVPGDTNDRWDVFLHDCATGETQRVSVLSGGAEGAGDYYQGSPPAPSAFARFIAFDTEAPLVPADTNRVYDVYVYDRFTGETTCVSVPTGSHRPCGTAQQPSISADGRYVTFSTATALVPEDTNSNWDVYLHDRLTGQTRRVSVASDGAQGSDRSWGGCLSSDGRFVAFVSRANNLVPGDTNRADDVFVHELATGKTERVSVASGGAQADGPSDTPSLSADGRYVLFRSAANNLVPDDTNFTSDIFLHDRLTGATVRVSVGTGGRQADSWSAQPAGSADARYVAFQSPASNLVPGDTNRYEDVFVHDRLAAIPPVAGGIWFPRTPAAPTIIVRLMQGSNVLDTRTVRPVAGGLARFNFGVRTEWGLAVEPVPTGGWEFSPANIQFDAPTTEPLIFAALPPPEIGPSTSRWDFGMGLKAGAWVGKSASLGPVGVSACKVRGALGADWGLALAVKRGGPRTILQVGSTRGLGQSLGVQLGPQAQLGPAQAGATVGATATLRATYGLAWSFDRVLDPADRDDRQVVGAALASVRAVLFGPTSPSPGTGILDNALYLWLVSLPDVLEPYEYRTDFRAGASLLTGAALGFGLKAGEGTSYSVGVDVASAEVETSVAGFWRRFVHPQPTEVAHALGAEIASRVDVGFLKLKLAQQRDNVQGLGGGGQFSLAPFLPKLGYTGIIQIRKDLDSNRNPLYYALAVTSDEQRPNALFGSQSNAHTVEVGVQPQLVAWMLQNADYRTMATDLLTRLASGGNLVLSTWDYFSDQYATFTALAARYALDHPDDVVGYIDSKAEEAQGYSAGFDWDFGLGFGLTVGFKGSYLDSWQYPLGRWELRGHPLCVHRYTRDTVAPRETRGVGWVLETVFRAAVEIVRQQLAQIIAQLEQTLDGAGQAVLTAADGAARVVVSLGSTASNWTCRLISALPSLTSPAQVRAVAVTAPVWLPYRCCTPLVTAAGVQWLEVASVGPVRVLEIRKPDGSLVSSWTAGKVTLRVRVTAQDLQNHWLPAALLPQVQIYRWDGQNYRWQALPTTREGDFFVAQPTVPGVYMPAIATTYTDTEPPVVVEGPSTNQVYRQGVEARLLVDDAPSRWRTGIDLATVALRVDGQPVSAGLGRDDQGRVVVSFVPSGRLVGGEHQLIVTAADLAGHQATLGPYRFRVRPAADLNEDWALDAQDIALFTTAWQQARQGKSFDPRCDLAPFYGSVPDVTLQPDGQLDARDAKAFLELWLAAKR
jgi:Tol biopolymer transport system component